MSEYIYATDEHEGHWLTGEEVVRCMDCKAFVPSGYCAEMKHKAVANGYCNWGARKDD